MEGGGAPCSASPALQLLSQALLNPCKGHICARLPVRLAVRKFRCMKGNAFVVASGPQRFLSSQ